MRTVQSDDYGLPQVFEIEAATLTSATVEGVTTATFTATTPHRLATGAKVRITGADLALFNGTYTVTVTSATVFTYLLIAEPADNADVTSVVAQQIIRSDEYDPFALIRNNRLQVEAATPDASLYIADTASHTGTWRELVALEDCVVNELTSSTLSGFADGMPIPKGTRITGAFTAIKLTSGKLLANS